MLKQSVPGLLLYNFYVDLKQENNPDFQSKHINIKY